MTAADGLTSAEAARLLGEVGLNAMEETRVHPIRRLLQHFWSPVPWMLEATVILQLAVHERLEALMIATLLLLNVALGVVHESRADATLALLKQRLAPKVRVRRDGVWRDGTAAELVPADIVQLSLGGIVPADLRLLSGQILLDQSMLTGESIAVEAGADAVAYAGGLVRRGEAIGIVTATGARTFFGRTAELVRVAHVESGEQKAVMGVVRTLTIVNFVIVVGMVAYALHLGMGTSGIVQLVLTAMLSAVPVALPATFTLAAALGARTLALQGVLLTRLTALHEAAMIDVLCVDKTGTLTENSLSVSGIWAADDAVDVLALAAAASSPDGQDPIDTAIRTAARAHGLTVTRFVPFDPTAKMAEAYATDAAGRSLRIVKGAPTAVAPVAALTPAAEDAVAGFSAKGFRTLAIAAGPPDGMTLAGLVAFSDPPRKDSAGLLAELHRLGVRTVMITGDAAATAATVAHQIGLEGAVCPPGKIPDSASPGDFAVYAGVLPEDKFRLVKAFQRGDHTVGMCGDGANDAPALRQAQMGIAVSTATDVAKSAAGIVLTDPGLGGIVRCIEEGRSSFQRVLTYTLSILVNKCATLVVMAAGLAMTGNAVLTPLLQALSMLSGDLVTMSRAADHARPSPYPNRWRVRNLTLSAIPLGVFKLAYCLGMLASGWFWLRLDPDQMRTLTFLMLVLAGQANTFILRERGHFWHSEPAWIMVLASLTNIAIVTGFASFGVLMTPLPVGIVGTLFGATALYGLGLDTLKVLMFRYIRID